MLGLSEIAVIGVIVLVLLVLGGRSRRDRLSDSMGDGAEVWEARATIRIPKYLVTVLLALVAAAAVAGAAVWLQFPVWVGALSGGVVAGAGVVAAMQRGAERPRR